MLINSQLDNNTIENRADFSLKRFKVKPEVHFNINYSNPKLLKLKKLKTNFIYMKLLKMYFYHSLS